MDTQVTQQESNHGQLQSYNDNLIMDIPAMNHMMKVAEFMSGGTMTLPQPYQKNPANCLAVVMQAAQWRMNPYAVAQKTHFVNGTIGYEAQLVSAVIQQSGVVTGMFKFEWFGSWERIVGKFVERESKKKEDDNGYPKKYKVPAWSFDDEEGVGIIISATLKGESEPRELTLLLKQATTRNSTLWADDPKQQIAYLAQKRWARLYAPGVILGVYTADELDTIKPEIDVTPSGNKPDNPDPVPTVYTDEEFNLNMAAWKKVVDNGKEPDRFIAFIEANGKRFTDEQKEVIRNWKKVVIEGEAKQVDDDFVNDMNKAEGKQ